MQKKLPKLLLITRESVLKDDIFNLIKNEYVLDQYSLESASSESINDYSLIISDIHEIKSLYKSGQLTVPLLTILSDSDNVPEIPSDERIAEDYIKLPMNKDELNLKIKALIRRNDIYKSFGEGTSKTKVQIEANKILLIDDDLKLVRLFEYNLTKANFVVKVATGGLEAAEIMKSFTPDIIVCDIMMPEMDGYEFRKFLLEDPKLKQIPFVFLTAKGDEQDILEGYDLEIEDYIIKTAGPRVLIARLSAILKSLEKERKKLVSEIHQAADNLKAKVVPDNDPAFDGFSLKHWHQPYKGIPGGDFIDYFKIDDENLAVILGDVMGKKWGAWFFAFAYAGYIRSAIRVVLQSAMEFSSASLLQRINESIYQDAKVSEVFSTLSIVILNKSKGTAVYAGAGDFPVIHQKSAQKEIIQINSDGLLLGFAKNGKYTDSLIKLNVNDRLILLTDGLIESRNTGGEQFGVERLKSIIEASEPGADLISNIKKGISEFTNENFEDDISVITIQSV